MSLKKSTILLLAIIMILYTLSGTALAVDEEIDRLVLSKNEINLEIGSTQSLTATAIYVSGKTEDASVKTDWTSGTPSVASVYAGTITAKAEGTAVITATYKGKTVVVNVTVNKKVKALTKDIHTINVRTGVSQQVELTAVYQDGTTEIVTNKADWTIDNYAIATVTNGLVKGVISGTATVTAKFGNQTATIPVSIEIVKRLDPSKAEVSLLLDGSEKVKLMATFPDGTVEDVAEKAEWSTDKEAVADALKGTIKAYGAGQATITAKYGTKTTTIKVDVDSTQKLEIDNQSLFLQIDDSKQLKLEATYMDGSKVDVTSKAVWSSSDEDIASVNKGLVQALSTGEVAVTAKYAEKTIKVNVDVAVARRLDVNEEFVSLKVGETEQLELAATYANGTTEDDIANKAEWTSSNEDVAYVNKGKITAYKSGEATITAKYSGKIVTVLVDVDIPRILKADKTNVAIQSGSTHQLTLTAVYADGREENITNQAAWTSGSSAVAEVRRGLITGIATGATSVTAKFGTRTLVIPVSIGVIKSLTADQKKLILEKGASANVTLTVVYTDGTSKDVTSLAAWAVGNADVATADAGVVEAINYGKTNVTASFENKTVTIPLEVDVAQTLSINPKILMLGKNETKQVTVEATDSNGNMRDVTADAEWTSSAPAVVEVSKGLVTAYGGGKATITAKYGGKTINLPVEIEVVERLEADVRYLLLKSGEHHQVQVIATLSSGATKDVTNEAEWKTSLYKVADVKGGYISANGYGKTGVEAKYGGKSVRIDVEVDQLKYLKTSEVMIELKKGESKKITATATHKDGTDQDVSVPALWTSTNILVADVKDGIIKANGTGKATVTVSYAGMKTKVVVIIK